MSRATERGRLPAASTVSLVLQRAGGRVLMVVQDDREGFDPSLHSEDLGLVSRFPDAPRAAGRGATARTCALTHG